MKKRVLAFALAVAFMFVFTVCSFAGFGEYEITDGTDYCIISVDNPNGEVGDEITMTLTLDNIIHANCGSVFISYDKTRLEFVDAEVVDRFASVAAGQSVDYPNPLGLSFASIDALDEMTVTAARYTFKVLEEGDYDFNIEEFSLVKDFICDEGEHDYEFMGVSSEGICTESHEALVRCRICGDIEHVLMPPSEHNFSRIYMDDYGIICRICSRCFYEESTDYILGDCLTDGVIDAKDARYALRIGAELEHPTDMEFFLANVIPGDTVDSKDARKILRVSAELERLSINN